MSSLGPRSSRALAAAGKLCRCVINILLTNEVKWCSGPVAGILASLLMASFVEDDVKICNTVGICAWMVVWWLNEVVAMGITGLLPMVFLPLLGIIESSDISGVYFSDTVVIMWGSIIMTTAIEKYNLHTIFADYYLKARLSTLSPRWLLLGFIVSTGFLSMWMSNTATAALLCPLSKAVISELELIDSQRQLEGSRRDYSIRSLATATDLGVAYAASLGGMATLTGTGANLVLQGTMNSMFGQNVGISFLGWLLLAGPIAWMNLVLLWVILCAIYLVPPTTVKLPCCFHRTPIRTAEEGQNVELQMTTYNDVLNNNAEGDGFGRQNSRAEYMVRSELEDVGSATQPQRNVADTASQQLTYPAKVVVRHAPFCPSPLSLSFLGRHLLLDGVFVDHERSTRRMGMVWTSSFF
jgi:hypothetical protein